MQRASRATWEATDPVLRREMPEPQMRSLARAAGREQRGSRRRSPDAEDAAGLSRTTDLQPSQDIVWHVEAGTDKADLLEVYEIERHLLYLACTRAGDSLWIAK